jgi:hypothetical protein
VTVSLIKRSPAATAPATRGKRRVDSDDIYELMDAGLARHLRLVTDQVYDDGTPMTVEDLVALDEWKNPDNGRIAKVKVRHELREGIIHYSEVGIVGILSLRAFEAMVEHSYHECVAQLKREQAGIEWTLVGVEIVQNNIRRVHEVAFAGEVLTEEDYGRFAKSKVPVALERKKDHAEAPEYRAEARLIFADLAGGELTDPVLNSWQGKPGPMTRYAETRNIGHMTDSQRQHRREIVKLLREFYANVPPRAAEGVDPLPPETAPGGGTHDDEPAVAPGELNEAETALAVSMRTDRDNPQTPGKIAKALGKTEAAVKRALAGASAT